MELKNKIKCMEEWKFLSDSDNNTNWAKISPDGNKILVKEIICAGTTFNRAGEFPYSIRYFLIDVATCKKSELNEYNSLLFNQ